MTTIEQALSRIRSAFDDLSRHSPDPLCDFCSGALPGDLPESSAETLGQLHYVPGRHAGVSEDSPEILVTCSLLAGRRIVVGYDDYKGGRGMAVPYNPEDDVIAEVTDEEIRVLLAEAGQAGDREQVRLCRLALDEGGGSPGDVAEARAECARVIAEARLEREAPAPSLEFTTWGSVRGRGPIRSTIGEAQRDLEADRRACRAPHYSDRQVYGIDADGYLVDPEHPGTWIRNPATGHGIRAR